MLTTAFLAALNHLLQGEDWARAHLKPFAGQTVRLDVPPMRLDLSVTADGRFARAQGESPAAVTLTLPADAPIRLLGGLADRSSLMASAQIQGSADFADCLGFVLRNLQWDVESDLAPLVGDIAAHRLVRFGGQFIAWQRKAAWSLAQNLAEYLTEEQPALAGRRDVARFAYEVDAVVGKLPQVERRISALEASRQIRIK